MDPTADAFAGKRGGCKGSGRRRAVRCTCALVTTALATTALLGRRLQPQLFVPAGEQGPPRQLRRTVVISSLAALAALEDVRSTAHAAVPPSSDETYLFEDLLLLQMDEGEAKKKVQQVEKEEKAISPLTGIDKFFEEARLLNLEATLKAEERTIEAEEKDLLNGKKSKAVKDNKRLEKLEGLEGNLEAEYFDKTRDGVQEGLKRLVPFGILR
eukprot:TRINITY_DN13981_c0_g1_i1.p1 TRINITY_DN13981_c0_g1~~TRINITY_DN13981_c0_g1_i1.p1  ORF type:complete len:213 (+),score=69.78 TRINITY_DN13981_c0_g1_i1:78-716(+)